MEQQNADTKYILAYDQQYHDVPRVEELRLTLYKQIREAKCSF